MKVFLYILVALLLVLGVGGFLAYRYVADIPELVIEENASAKEKMDALDDWLQLLFEKKKFNGGVLIAKEGQAEFIKTYGYTDFTQKERLTNQSSFRLASLSKQFTCTGIMLLEQKGLLNFDDLVSKHLKGFPYEGVTIRHLMNHTSGIPDSYMSLAPKHRDEIGDILTIDEVVSLIEKYPGKIEEPPLEQYAYNNTAYVLLAGIVENVSGLTFENFLQLELFDPLGMKNSRVWNLVSADETFENKTSSFMMLGGKELKPDFLDGIAGDGAVFSSLEDFLIWDDFWYNSPILSDKNRVEAFKSPTLNDGTVSNYGFGWGISKDGKSVSHTGSWLGARTYIGRDTDKKTMLVILDNGLNVNIEAIGKQIAKVM